MTDLSLARTFIQDRFADELAGFDHSHHSVKDMLNRLEDVDDHKQKPGRRRRDLDPCGFQSANDRVEYCRRQLQLDAFNVHPLRHRQHSLEQVRLLVFITNTISK